MGHVIEHIALELQTLAGMEQALVEEHEVQVRRCISCGFFLC